MWLLRSFTVATNDFLIAYSFIKYVKEKEILFIKTDLKKIRNDKTDYSRLIKYYKRKLVDYGVMKEIRKAKKQNVKYFGKRIKEQKIA